jgi:hypothetical protein
LTAPTLGGIRGDEVAIRLYLADNPASQPGAFQLKGRGRRLDYSALANEFLDVCVQIENTTGESSGECKGT